MKDHLLAELTPYLSSPCEVPPRIWFVARELAGVSQAEAERSISASSRASGRTWRKWEGGERSGRWGDLRAFCDIHKLVVDE